MLHGSQLDARKMQAAQEVSAHYASAHRLAVVQASEF